MDDVAFSAWLDRGVQTWGGWIVLAAVVWFYGGKILAWLRLPSLGVMASFMGVVLSSAGRFLAIEIKRRIPDTYQVEPPANQVVLSGSELVPNRDADILYLAQRREPDGAYTYSANKIAEFAGGTRTETLAKIRAARGEPDPAAQPPKRTIPHRVNGEERLMEVDW